ncbi:MAG TPA: hypothetical protein VFR87_17945 [Nocardioidaceae bacterium]|nr:hypothetical protein [Nocardioidaceae bacterium]
MSFWDSILGRKKPVQAKLDALFGLPGAAITLQTAAGFVPTGVGSVCYREAEGAAFAQTQADIVELLKSGDGPEVRRSVDEYGYTWLVTGREEADMGELVTDLHAVNTTLEAEGFGPGLLCSLVTFVDPTGRRLGLVYLYKQGTFYPFCPSQGQGQTRDNVLEIQIRDLLANELPMEQQLSRWMAVWGAPGL